MSSSAVFLSSNTPRSLAACFPPCDPGLNGASLQPGIASTPSLYIAFKVLQLVKRFRRRVKTGVQHARRHSSKSTKTPFCHDVERQAYEEIDRYLGRKTAHTHPKASDRTAAVTQLHKPTTQWLLDHVDQVVKAEPHSLKATASSDSLFFARTAELALVAEHIPTQHLTGLLSVVAELLRRLAIHSAWDGTVREGQALPHLHSEGPTANLQHLLLCLKDQLLRLLVVKLVELFRKHTAECQRDQSQHSAAWFFEYPNAQHPLSTTWPWSIRPSLAVLWGVCWMFYDRDHGTKKQSTNSPFSRHASHPALFDSELNMLDEQGHIIAESHLVIEYLSSLQQHNHGFHMANPRQASVPRQRLPPQAVMPHSGASPVQVPVMAAPQAQPQPQLRGLTPSSATSHSSSRSHRSSVTAGQAHGSGRFAIPATNNTYSAAPPASYAGPAALNSAISWLPEDNFGPAYPPDANTYWQQQIPPHAITEQQHQQQHQQQQAAAFACASALPPRSRNSLTPSISVTTDFHHYAGLQQPQDPGYQSTTPVTSASSLHPPDPFTFSANYPQAHQLSPRTLHFMNSSDQQEMQRTPPRSPHDTGLGESVSRKRSHSDISVGAAPLPRGESRAGSVASNLAAQSPGEEYSPRTRAFKRDEVPPMNADHKYVCTFALECSTLIFDRKCEWSKHMDKHDRPYRCSHAACAKLQGFTYSGGLLRHEREVHGKHGGPRSQMMCPYPECKRHSGKGFTRKENLNEHIRRVHQNRDEPSQGVTVKRDVGDAFAGADEMETPDGEVFDQEDQRSPVHKRRRQFSEGGEQVVFDEVDALRRENAEQAEMIATQKSQLNDQKSHIDSLELKLDSLEEEKQTRAEEEEKLYVTVAELRQQVQQLQQSQV